MLKIINKKYEIEEEFEIMSEDESEVVCKFDIKLTSDNLKTLRQAIMGKDVIKMANKLNNVYKMDEEEQDDIIAKAEATDEEVKQVIIKLCIGDSKDKIVEIGGEGKLEEVCGVISDYLLGFFIKKQTQRTNTINTDLAKITKK